MLRIFNGGDMICGHGPQTMTIMAAATMTSINRS